MNHLAHCFLSFGDEDLLIGNFSGDFVKGKAWMEYPARIQQGILLHRTIDNFTDHHDRMKVNIQRIRPFAGRYSGPVHDVLADHLLARHWDLHAVEPFDLFAEKTYRSLEKGLAAFPPVLQERIPRMVAGRFLHGYQTREGLEWALDRFSYRLPPDFDPKGLSAYFFENIEEFSAEFDAFFPELVAHARDFLYRRL
ncbi:MAG: ACP phosphodiesterase [Saprospiraceae bacterium]